MVDEAIRPIAMPHHRPGPSRPNRKAKGMPLPSPTTQYPRPMIIIGIRVSRSRGTPAVTTWVPSKIWKIAATTKQFRRHVDRADVLEIVEIEVEAGQESAGRTTWACRTAHPGDAHDDGHPTGQLRLGRPAAPTA